MSIFLPPKKKQTTQKQTTKFCIFWLLLTSCEATKIPPIPIPTFSMPAEESRETWQCDPGSLGSGWQKTRQFAPENLGPTWTVWKTRDLGGSKQIEIFGE